MSNKPFQLAIAQAICRNLPPIFAQRARNIIYPFAKAQQDDVHFIVKSQTGSELEYRTSEILGYTFGIHGYWDWRSLAVTIALCRKGDVIVEIGANAGTETVSFSDIVGRSGKVYAFEPLPANAEFLFRASTRCRNGNIHVSTYALAAEKKSMRFVPPQSDRNSGVGYLIESTSDSDPTIEVECLPLDSFMDKIHPAHMLFIDVEGAEMDVLVGAKDIICRDAPTIIIEANRKCLARSGFHVRDLHRELQALGYTTFMIGDFGIEAVNLGDRAPHRNWLCLPQGKEHLVRKADSMIKLCGVLPLIPWIHPFRRVQ